MAEIDTSLIKPAERSTSGGEVDAIFEMMRYPDLGALREQIAVFKRVKRNQSGFPVVRPAYCMTVTDALKEFFLKHRLHFVTQDAYLVDHFFGLVKDFRDSDITFYPTEVFRLDLVRAEALIAIDRPDEAISITEPFSQRPYLIEDDFGLLARLIEIDTLARLTAGRINELAGVAVGRIRLLSHWRPREVHGWFGRMASVIALSATGKESIADRIVGILALLVVFQRRWVSRRSVFRHILGGAAEQTLTRLAAVVLRLSKRQWFAGRIQIRHPQGASSETPPLTKPVEPTDLRVGPLRAKPVLVSRAMGGLGDVAMMTPGVHVLARRFKRPIYFATKKAFFPLFENNPEVKLIDIDSYFDMSQFHRWFNLSNCPASKYEVRVAPFIKKSRVESFGNGMNVRKHHLNFYGWQPIVNLSDHQKKVVEDFRAEHAECGRELIGIQPYSRDSYKNCDSVFEAAKMLSKTYRVFLMHTSPLPVEENENLICLIGNPLRDALAITSALDYYIAVDSAFYHLTAAFDVPTLGIFGPTSGVTLSKHHLRFRLVKPPVPFPCAPCWRNEDSPCSLTLNNRSACLTAITGQHICDEFELLRSKYPAGTKLVRGMFGLRRRNLPVLPDYSKKAS